MLDSRALTVKLRREVISSLARAQPQADQVADEEWANEGGSVRHDGAGREAEARGSGTSGLFRKGQWAIIVNQNGARHAILGSDYSNCCYEPPFADLISADDYDELVLSRLGSKRSEGGSNRP